MIEIIVCNKTLFEEMFLTQIIMLKNVPDMKHYDRKYFVTLKVMT